MIRCAPRRRPALDGCVTDIDTHELQEISYDDRGTHRQPAMIRRGAETAQALRDSAFDEPVTVIGNEPTNRRDTRTRHRYGARSHA